MLNSQRKMDRQVIVILFSEVWQQDNILVKMSMYMLVYSLLKGNPERHQEAKEFWSLFDTYFTRHIYVSMALCSRPGDV